MNPKNKQQFAKSIRDIFKYILLSDYKEVPKEKKVSFTISSSTSVVVQWSMLKELSLLLGTEDIGFEGDFEYGYYEEIDHIVSIYCLNVKFSEAA